jgi:hypothetical protein
MSNFVMYSAWASAIPEMDIGYVFSFKFNFFFLFIAKFNRRDSVLMKAVTFQHYKHFINPSRVDPTYVRVKVPFTPGRGHLYVANSLAMCLSVGFSTESLLLEGPQDRKVRQKQISILLHTQEGERYGAFACMVFNANKHSMVAQVSDTGLSFSTMAQTKEKPPSQFKMVSPVKSPLISHLETKTGRRLSARTKTAIDFDERGHFNLLYA